MKGKSVSAVSHMKVIKVWRKQGRQAHEFLTIYTWLCGKPRHFGCGWIACTLDSCTSHNSHVKAAICLWVGKPFDLTSCFGLGMSNFISVWKDICMENAGKNLIAKWIAVQSQIKGVNSAVFGGGWSPWNHSICASYQWSLWELTCHTIAWELLAYIRRYFHLKSTCHTIAWELLAFIRRYFHLKSTPYKNVCFKVNYVNCPFPVRNYAHCMMFVSAMRSTATTKHLHLLWYQYHHPFM